MQTRRDLLKTTAAIAGSLILPKTVLASSAPTFHFLHADSYKDWPVADPVQWSLQNAHAPILARAAEGLEKLTISDGDRIVRLVVRRCSLNLLEVQGNKVHVQFWGQQGLVDLKPFFKSHGLARPEVEVALKDRKKDTFTTMTGDDFLYGVPLASDFDLEHFQSKWVSRFEQQADDWMAAPGTSSGFAWDSLPDGSIPWAAMKSAWRRGGGVVCQNCSVPTLLVNFGLRQVGVFNRSGYVEHVCGKCRRSFKDETVDLQAWIVANLDEVVWPDAEMVWGKRVKLETQS
jgi:hypothetical protein